MLLCTVRDCRQPLTKLPDQRRATCPRGHSFDIARTGYLNLLQPQDRRSKNPGDSAEAVAGRRRIYDLGIAEPLLAAITAAALPTPSDSVLDAGCGDGYYLGSIAATTGCAAHGIDISIPAIEAAARRYSNCEWLVANADRFIPCADSAFSLILSITARRNPPEFRRTLRDDGRLLIALPAPDDLKELRGAGRTDRVDATVAEFESDFTLAAHTRATTVATLAPDVIAGLLHSVYRPLGPPPAAAAIITFSLDLLLFRPRKALRTTSEGN